MPCTIVRVLIEKTWDCKAWVGDFDEEGPEHLSLADLLDALSSHFLMKT